MNDIHINYYRNIGISAHIDAGKTTTTERILYYAGISHKMGEVHDGQAIMDWMPQEQERGITITSAATTIFWNGMFNNYPKYRINIIDTPGHVDFTIEVERCMRIIDGVCMVYCAVAGVQSQSEVVWRQSNKYNVSKLIFVNKMDRIGADYFKIYNELKHILKANPVPIYIPYIVNNIFIGVIDLLKLNIIIWNDDTKGMSFSCDKIPDTHIEYALIWRKNILEMVVNEDDDLMEKYLNTFELSEDLIIKFLREKTISCEIQPMLCGSAFKNKGIQCILDVVINYFPSPLDLSEIKGESLNGIPIIRKVSENEKFAALAFKVVTDPFVGQLIYFRVYCGIINCGDWILNSTKNKKERISRILQVHANNKQEIKNIGAGDIGAIVGLKSVITGDTLCDFKNPIILEKINFPQPVISQSIILKNKSDQEKINIVLNKLIHEDPSFFFHIDQDSNQIIISGMGELHLEILVERMKREFALDLIVEKPKVSYRETIKSSVYNIEGKYIRQSGGRGQYGHVVINMKPNIRGQGYKFFDEIKNGVIPKEYINVVEKSMEELLKNGVLGGYPVLDIIIYLIDGTYHEVDSSENAFKIASSIAFKNAMKNADPVLLEPIMYVDIELPDNYVGTVISDISSRRGLLISIDDLFSGLKIIKCTIPLSEMFGYSTDLRSLSQGRGTYNMFFKNYLEVPKNLIKLNF